MNKKLHRGIYIPVLLIASVLFSFFSTEEVHARATYRDGVMEQSITISIQKESLEAAIEKIRSRIDVRFAYDAKSLCLSDHYTSALDFKDVQLGQVLDRLLTPAGITYKEVNNTIILQKKPEPVRQQERTVSGKVTDDKGESLPGVTVIIKNTQTGTVTDKEGNFKIDVPSPDAVLVFSFVGMLSQEVPVGNQATLNVRLDTNTHGLSEVVVTALGISREAKSLSYSTQQINTEALNETKEPNIINSLSGKVAGVQVVPSGFNTGSARIVIRGNSSLTGNNQPLFVVDGMPIDNAPGDGSLDYGNNAADINPADIEDIQILKGPNAAALYGSRAANGVVLITTKRGSDKFKVSLNSSTMFQTLTEFPEYQNAYGVGTSSYIDNRNRLPKANVNYRSWGSPMLGQPYIALNGEEKAYLPQPNNVKDFYTTAHLLTNSISVEGGSAKNNYRLSYTNLEGNSVVKGFNENSRNTIALAMQNKPSDWITFNSKINFIRNAVENRQYTNGNGRNPTLMYTHMARSTDLAELLPYKDAVTGEEIGTHRNFSNPYWIINENPNRDVKDRVIASFNPEIKLTDWLKFTGRLGVDVHWWEGYEFNNIGSTIGSNREGFMRTFNTRQQHFNTEGLLSVNKDFDRFSVVAIAGASSFSSDYEKREQRINSLLQPGLINLSNAKEPATVSQNLSKKSINSVFGSVSLGYNDYAFLDVTGRNDWSSTLPEGNNSYFYPSVGGSLVISEMFDYNKNLFSFAKLRGSYARVGNDTDPYRLYQTYSFDGFFDGATLASLSTTMNNPDLKPELTSSVEFGVDLKFLQDRISLDATKYTATTTNQIIRAQLPASSGYTSRLYNAGEIKNWGFEASLTGLVIQKPKFSWEAQANFARNNSEVVELLGDITRFQLGGDSRLGVYAEVGKPYAYLRGLGVKRDEQGRMLLQDGGGKLQEDNDMAFGTATPDYLASLRNTFRFGGFDLSFLLDYKKGGILYSQSMSLMLVNGVHAETLQGRDDYYLHSIIYGESDSELTGGAMWDAYFADGTKNNRYMSPQNYEYARPNYAEFVIYDASYLKLRELVLGYNLPANLLAKTPVKSARISLVGRNLAILYRNTPRGIDPEATSTSGNAQGIERGALPPNAIYGFNVNLNF
ncbi:SusC/RagA family TonB-linked outer membrane protein [Pontibacter amylolyticus]|nr:SusC/RagA family TonB-linked outer membrane protein [Pontibacter amylolyticus]